MFRTFHFRHFSSSVTVAPTLGLACFVVSEFKVDFTI